MKIWIVDDDRIQLLINNKAVSKVWPEADVTTFLNPMDAISAFRDQEKPDMLLLDLTMPELSGFEFLEYMTIQNICLDVYIVSSSIDPQEIEQSKNYPSVKSFIMKPLTKSKLETIKN